MTKTIEEIENKLKQKISQIETNSQILNNVESVILLEKIKNNDFLPFDFLINKEENITPLEMNLRNCDVYFIPATYISPFPFSVQKTPIAKRKYSFLLPNIETEILILFSE